MKKLKGIKPQTTDRAPFFVCLSTQPYLSIYLSISLSLSLSLHLSVHACVRKLMLMFGTSSAAAYSVHDIPRYCVHTTVYPGREDTGDQDDYDNSDHGGAGEQYHYQYTVFIIPFSIIIITIFFFFISIIIFI